MSPVRFDPTGYGAWFDTALGRRVWTDELRAVAALLGPLSGRRVLDAGCGDGRLAVVLAGEGARVVGADIDVSMLRAARARGKEAKVELSLVAADVARVPLASESFDTIVAVTTLCFVPDPRAAARELARLLRPGGRLVIGELGRWSSWALSRRLRALLRPGPWRAARFWTRSALIRLVREVDLVPGDVRGAVFYPRNETLGRILSPLDPLLGPLMTVGAAFVAVRGDKPAHEGVGLTASSD